MMARKDNVAMRESNDNIDLSFSDEVFRNRMH